MENMECKAQTIQTILGTPAILLQFQKKEKKKKKVFNLFFLRSYLLFEPLNMLFSTNNHHFS